MQNIEIYLDMDGVLASFNSAIEDNKHRLEYLEKQIWDLIPEIHGSSDLEMKEFFAEKQIDPVMIKAKKIYKIYLYKFYRIMSEPGFFLNLEPMPGMLNLVQGVIHLNDGKLPHILTAPIQSPHCVPEKELWVKKHISGMYDKFICQKNKTEYSEPTSILIDDLKKNTIPWDAAGGFAVLHTGDIKSTLKQVAEFIEEVKNL